MNKLIEQTCPDGSTFKAKIPICSSCHTEDCETRYSLGIYAGTYCDSCWDKSGYRKEDKEGYDYLDAGEAYEADEY